MPYVALRTYASALEEVSRVANALKELGVKTVDKNTRVFSLLGADMPYDKISLNMVWELALASSCNPSAACWRDAGTSTDRPPVTKAPPPGVQFARQ